MRRFLVLAVLACMAAAPVPEVITAFSCGTDIGVGLKSRRKFCDIVISTQGRDGVAMAIPAHTGPSTLRFDLHNRYTLPDGVLTPGQAYAKHTAIVSVLDQTGAVVSRAAVARELRTEVDVFDRIAGGIGPGGAIAVAPGQAEAVVIQLPESVNAIAVVGVSLEAMSKAENGTFTTPGRPVALGSNFRIEYTRR